MRVAFSIQQNTVISNNQIVSFCTLIAIDKALKKPVKVPTLHLKKESSKSRSKCYRSLSIKLYTIHSDTLSLFGIKFTS